MITSDIKVYQGLGRTRCDALYSGNQPQERLSKSFRECRLPTRLPVDSSAGPERYRVRYSVCFGAVETPMTEDIRSPKFIDRTLAGIPMAPIAGPDEVAAPCCFLLSDAASYITGQHLSIDGGAHIGF